VVASGLGPKRARQAQGVRGIVDALVAAGERHVVVAGDLVIGLLQLVVDQAGRVDDAGG
jgi:hypothetical protein